MGKIILPGDFEDCNYSKDGVDIWVKLDCPNPKLLTDSWDIISKELRMAKGLNTFLKKLQQLAMAYGEINRYHSKKLPTKYILLLQSRMTECRRLLSFINKRRKMQGKPEVLSKRLMDAWFSGKDSI